MCADKYLEGGKDLLVQMRHLHVSHNLHHLADVLHTHHEMEVSYVLDADAVSRMARQLLFQRPFDAY